ncbi:DUF3168 domain-containing protein [Micromonospora sp. NPDC049891]|uniref:DUF3168 domain-containing protein n=1 Tax=Micromonospora sp. NPDC049891 TaxID=3155655 RepID=UPI0033C978DE
MTAPVSRSPIHPVQKAIYQRLTADTILMAALTGGVHDQVPEDKVHPYLRIGDHLSVPDNDHGGFGREITVTLHVWTRSRGNTQGQTIAGRLIELLDHQHLPVEGHNVVSVRHEFDQALTDPNPEIRHHVVRFRIVTSQQ